MFPCLNLVTVYTCLHGLCRTCAKCVNVGTMLFVEVANVASKQQNTRATVLSS